MMGKYAVLSHFEECLSSMIRPVSQIIFLSCV
jgi:hypothetical protein